MRFCLFAVLALPLLFSNLAAQTKDANSAAKNTVDNEKAARELEAERILKERRANAQSLLVSLAIDARHFTDDRMRARSLARIADLLWASDRERSRSLFRSAWDAAELADAKSLEETQADIRRQRAENPGGGHSYISPPNLRREVLDLAGRRDPALGEEFLHKYAEQKATETAKAQNRRSNSLVTDEATEQRFGVAADLVRDGEVERALRFADPALGSINTRSVEFLARLRERNAAAADRRYAAMVTSASTNPQSEANTVSLLASYIFTPRAFVVFLPNSASMIGGLSETPANVSNELRAAFFRTATTILLRPLGDQSQPAIDAQYLAVKRMMPLFERYASGEALAALKSQFESLGAVASTRARDRNDQFMRAGLEPSKPPPDREDQSTRPAPESGKSPPNREQSLIERRDSAKTPPERDRINLELALMMIDKDDRRAHDYVDKIDDKEMRDSARSYVDASIAWKLTSQRDVERALELARTGSLTHFQKAWLLARTANLGGGRDREQVAMLIDYAATEARRIETSDPDRPRAFLAIANVVVGFNRANIWEIMNDAIKAANSADRFTGEDGAIAFRLNVKGMNSSYHHHRFGDFDLAGIFSKLANEDYDKAVELARGLQNGAPRANAVVAIARTVMDEKKK